MDKKEKGTLPMIISMIGVGILAVSLADYIHFNYFNATPNELFFYGIILGLLIIVPCMYFMRKNNKRRIV